MKRTGLMRRIARQAKRCQVEWVFVRQGGEHEVWRCGREQVIVPRHREVLQYTAEGIMRSLEPELGKDWWRR